MRIMKEYIVLLNRNQYLRQNFSLKFTKKDDVAGRHRATRGAITTDLTR